MYKMKKLYEYEIAIQLNYQFVKRIEIDEQTKTVGFELIAIDVNTNEEEGLIKSTSDLNLEYKIEDIYEQLDNGFAVNGKEFLLKDNDYAELGKKVLKEVKQCKE